MQTPHYIYGIDFSGTQDAGKKIWIAKAFVDGKSLFIEYTRRARDQLNTVDSLDQCLPALLDFIKKNMDSAFGFDFPFVLPKDLVTQGKWEDFILSFPDLY